MYAELYKYAGSQRLYVAGIFNDAEIKELRAEGYRIKQQKKRQQQQVPRVSHSKCNSNRNARK